MTRNFLLASIALTATAPAQVKKTLTIGDPAPPLKVEAWVKGAPFKIEKGKVYVVEFWATWCGPCIESMPRLSALADKMKGKVQIVSVNMSDRSPAGESSPGSKIHVDRISKWVKANTSKMRYNVALDDSKSTMASTWMGAAKQTGIPCAFVVNQQGQIAWIGHPDMGLDKVVEAVYAKKFDMKDARNRHSISMKVPLQAEADKEALRKLARKGDLEEIEKVYMTRVKATGHPDFAATSLIAYELSKTHRSVALKFIENRAGSDQKGENTMYGGTLVYISPNFKGTKEAGDLVKLSLQTANTVRPENAAIEYAYHARVLLALGDKARAKEWLDKATSKLSSYEPAEYRHNMKKYIEDSKKRVAMGGQ